MYTTIRRHPRWSHAYKYYTAAGSLFVVVRFVSQFTWNDASKFSKTTQLVLK